MDVIVIYRITVIKKIMASKSASDFATVIQQGCINSANKLIKHCKLSLPRISSFQDLNSNFFIALFEGITGYSVPDLLPCTDTFAEEHNVQAVIDTLSLDLLGLSLYHISGENIVSGDAIAISNLLEVLEAVSLYLFEQNAQSKDSRDGVSSRKFKTSSSEIGHRKSSSNVLTYGENVPPVKVLKRKTCRNTLRKFHSTSVYKRNLPCSSSSSSFHEHKSLHSNHQPENFAPLSTTEVNDVKQTKREITEPVARGSKLYTEDVEKLYALNFEKKIRALLLSDKSPQMQSLQMKRNYLQNLKTPLKRSEIPDCRKSYLLPYNLRRKSVQPNSQKVKKRKVQKGESLKAKTSQKTGRRKTENSMPLLIDSLLEEFPGFQFPKNTLSLLTKHYYQHLGHIHKQMRDVLFKKPVVFVQAVRVSEEQSKLSNVMTKDLRDRNYLRKMNEQKAFENRIKYGLRDARLRSVKMKQYVQEFHTSMKRKLQKRNYSEELVIEKTFKEVLDLQKEKVQTLCQKVKEADEQDAKEHRKYLTALHHLYQEQLNLLSESLVAKRQNCSQRTKDQNLAVAKIDQEFCDKLRKDIRSLQNDVLEMLKDVHFRELDAENYLHQKRLQD